MNRKVIAIDLALVALAAALGWQIRERWMEGAARQHEMITAAARRMAVLPPPPLAALKPVTAAEYLDVAQKMLFSKDRNPNVIIEPPAPKPKPPLPALPEYYGQMAIGPPVVVLAAPSSPQKSYHVGEKVGPFQIEAFDSETITFLWEDEKVERRLDDLRPKEAPPKAATTAATRQAAKPAPANSQAVITRLDTDPKADDKNPVGIDIGGGYSACKPGDQTPSGTVVNGYKKIVTRGLMGESCQWQSVK
jgi:hypothetical protein